MTRADHSLASGLEAVRLTRQQALRLTESLVELDRSMPTPMTTQDIADAIRGIPVVGGAAGAMKASNPEHIDWDRHRAEIEPGPALRSPLVSHPETARGPAHWTAEQDARIRRHRRPEHASRPARAEPSTGPKLTEDDLV